jgi:hypothetical protein
MVYESALKSSVDFLHICYLCLHPMQMSYKYNKLKIQVIYNFNYNLRFLSKVGKIILITFH